LGVAIKETCGVAIACASGINQLTELEGLNDMGGFALQD
jgi:hypothetical protein